MEALQKKADYFGQLSEDQQRLIQTFLTMLDNFPEILYVVDPYTYEVIFVNRVFADLLGRDVRGEHCYKAFQGLEAPCDFCTNEIILKNRKPYTWEYYNPMLDKHFWITDQIIKWPDGRDVRYELAVDISKQKALEEDLRKSEERFRNLVETSNDWIWEVDQNGKYTYSGPQVEQLLGHKVDEVLGKTPFDFMPPQEAKRIGQAFQDILADKRDITNLENTNLHKNGKRVIMETSGVPFYNQKGELEGYRGMDRDITERVRNREKLQMALKKLEQSNRELGQFAYVASHDLQEPLRAVASFSQLLKNRYRDELDDEGREFIDFIVDGSKRMQKLITDLLFYSRLDSRDQKINPIDLNVLLGSVRVQLQNLISEQEATVSCDDLPTLNVDEAQFLQLFQNLISNAIKFRKDNEPPWIHVGAVENDDEWVISVKDNGIGIDQKYFGKIFKMFQRLHSREEFQGTGMGLAICSKIIEKHGGKIWVDSIFNEGSIFSFSIPKKKYNGGEDES